MTTWGEKLDRRHPKAGRGIMPLPVPIEALEPQSKIFASFVKGLDMSDAPERVQLHHAVYAVDMEVTRNDRLQRSPGILEIGDVAPRSLIYTFQQASIDYIVELVAIDPPWLGYKGSGAWNFVNLGLTATGLTGWVALNYLGDLLFSNGVDASYSRAPGAIVVTNQTANIIARTFAQQFGRIFAGYWTAAGAARALGIKWNDTTGLLGGWAGAGSGNEFLINPDGSADYVVAIRALGFDLLAICNRNSLWAGYPTGRAARPADFRFRFGGVGCVAERTCRVTPGGVTFLSEEGVVNYNVNSAGVISHEINSEILPLDFNDLGAYSGSYVPTKRRYYLNTPIGVYIYEFPIVTSEGVVTREARWFKRSTLIDLVLGFSEQSALTPWDALVGTWDAQAGAWDNLGLGNAFGPAIPYFIQGSKYGKEDPSIFTAFGVALTPKWRTPQALQEMITSQVTTLGWEISYVAATQAEIRLMTPSPDGDSWNTVTKVLPATGGQIKRKVFWNQQFGMGVQTQVEVVSGSPEILHMRQFFQHDSPVVAATANG